MPVTSRVDKNFEVDKDHFWTITIACLIPNSSLCDWMPQALSQGHAFLIVEGEETDPQKKVLLVKHGCGQQILF